VPKVIALANNEAGLGLAQFGTGWVTGSLPVFTGFRPVLKED
jgi:hypothetical protein